jgi:hypothetical protein
MIKPASSEGELSSLLVVENWDQELKQLAPTR